MTRRQPRSTLFPYTTLFRSRRAGFAVSTALTERFRTLVLEGPDGETRAAALAAAASARMAAGDLEDRKSTRLNSSHSSISYAVFCLKKKKKNEQPLGRARGA